MTDTLPAQADVWRLGVFLAVLAGMALAEALFVRRPRQVTRWRRWTVNFTLVAVDSLLVRLLLPTAAIGAALWAQQHSFGLLHALAWPDALDILVALLLLDLAIYAQHLLMHHVPVLWRLHRMHHSDTEIDVSTGLRFHPLEILLSMALKMALVVALGAPVLAVLIFEILLNATSLFNHANLRLPSGLDRILRLFVVTPDMHRVHHSWHVDETNSNFGFNVPWWDRLFGTYTAQPRDGHLGMTIGLHDFRQVSEQTLPAVLLQPFRTPRTPPAANAPTHPNG